MSTEPTDGEPNESGVTAPADTIVGISFDDAFRAQEYLTAAHRLVAHHDVELLDAVIIAKLADGRTVVRETTDPGPGQSALTVGMWTSLAGLLLAGPIGWVAGAAVGAGAGAIRARVRDTGIPDEWVSWFREAAEPGSFTVVLLLGTLDESVVISELERFAGGRLVYANVPPDVVRRIRDALRDPATGPLTQQDEANVEPGSPLPPPDPAAMVDPPVSGEPS